nr:pyocin knob domain-containing protein [Escherichia coli]
MLAQTTLSTELYIPDGFVKQTAAPSGYIEGNVVRIYDQVNKPTKADLGLSNAMLTGAFGLGGSGIATNGKMSDVEILKALRDKGGHFWRGDKPTGSTATIYSHGSGIFSRCGDTWSAINIDYSTAKIKIYAGNDARLNNGTFSVNELYGSANKPSKSDVGLGNVTNDAQVKKTGDTMTGDLTIKKGTPSVFLRADSGVTALRFYTGDNTERGIIYAGPNTDSLGEVRIRAKTAGGTSGGDLVVRHDGRVEVRDLTVAYKIKSRTIEIANTDTDSSATTLSIYGVQHTPLVLTRSGSSENVSIGFKLDNVNPKYLGIDTNGDLAFGESPDQKQNSKLITQAKLDKGLTIGGQLAFKGTTAFSAAATFSAGIAGAIEPEAIDGRAIDLNDLIIANTEAGSVKYYQCKTVAGGANITNKPDGVSGNFLVRVESIRKTTGSDYANMQTLINSDTKRIYVRFVVNGSWAAWSQVVVSGWGQDVSVKSLRAVALSGSLTGNASTATKLQTARTIGGVSFDGSANIDLPGVNKAGNQSTTGNAATATKLQTARTIGGVSFDGSANINLPGVNTTGNQNTTGNAATATKLQTARNINGVPFDGTKDITLTPKDLDAYSKSEVQSALAGKQPLDNTLTNLSGKDVAGLLAYLQLGEAAKRDVGTGNNQLPDMSAFGMSRNGQTAWDILPNGMIRQVGTVTLTPVGNFNAQVLGGVTYYTHYYRVNFPRQFPNAQIATLATLASYSISTQSSMAGKSLATHRDTDSGTDVSRTRFTVSYTTPNLGEIPTLHFEAIGY